MKYTEKQIKILKELLRRLDGKCNNSMLTCPIVIDSQLFPSEDQPKWAYSNNQPHWACTDCGNMFAFIFKNDPEHLWQSKGCPCTHPKTRQIAIATVEEAVAAHKKA